MKLTVDVYLFMYFFFNKETFNFLIVVFVI